MKKTMLICLLLLIGLVTLNGCHTYSRAYVGADYEYGYPYYPYGYDPYYAYNYPYYPYYPYPAYYYPYYPFYPYPFFTLGFGFSNVIIDGRFVRGGRVLRGTVPGRSGGRVMRR